MEELISKKELLEKYGISYGALYRWKRMGLIPEDWFEKKSAVTGQETFFPRAAICERIEMILELKDQMSLEEIAAQVNGEDMAEKRHLRIVWDGGTTQIPLTKIHSVHVIIGDDNMVVDLTPALGKTAEINHDSIAETVNDAVKKVAQDMKGVDSHLKQVARDLEEQIEEAKKIINELMNTKGND